ncbi:MAG: 30S ribosomal protein S9 [Candidatus Marinimicrobia bacterium]|nr:30S ribosomal protein S9 [Candidatus Neomarinimicrobiota bacterium]|tara:strand:+ start:304 stop:702 length:399 start_codon:yes stop_codon:yes gene_type:complete
MAPKSDIVFARTGRRKTAVARVRVIPGKGDMSVNGRDYKEYFGRTVDQKIVEKPFDVIDSSGYAVSAIVRGGGPTGQAGAIRHGISRALVNANEDFKPALKKAGLLTRDAREKERKKYGLRGARRAFQFSKR